MKQCEDELKEVLEAFDFGGNTAGALRYGSGHINDTFAVYVQTPKGESKRFILQRINTNIFSKPMDVMENILGVTRYLREKISAGGGDPSRETLQVIYDKDGKCCYTDSDGGFWRCFPFVEGTICLQTVENQEQFYECGYSFGTFLKNLAGYPADTLHETIPDFHNTPQRFKNLLKAVNADPLGRTAMVQKELEFIYSREGDLSYLEDRKANGILPLRVTHNDTKLNNILLDEKTQKGICIIDLDTIMPGLMVTDFGDSIRFGASTAAEDEQDLSKVMFDINLYRKYVAGYMDAAGDVITGEEKRCMPWGAKLMTLECGMRFLTDYIEGDHYFKTAYEGHNLDRCRTQLKLVSEMEKVWGDL